MEIEDIIEEGANTDSGYAIAYAILKLAQAQQSTATALRMLGTADAATPMGAVEFLAMEVKTVADRLGDIAQAISNAPETT